MILNNTPNNEAVISNVGEIGEFRIRNSAKAFKILSDGLYANKVRAIIRELSCNAVDSHVAAGRSETPFDVHLPNELEPWFSIRDYGVGLSDHQVTNIYTTYFESTKTGSNDFIGALGLGSKSPFSYTDNFTVTAIKNGVRGIYTAFINEQGVPSIARMMQENTSDPDGVEVKFSVNSYYDYSRFYREATEVYKYFKLKPVVTGYDDFEIPKVDYDTRDIIPGVHSYVHKYDTASNAIMGNIAYPIQIPDSDKTLGSLKDLLRCGLEMHFDIGELDFQASREGLSYIPQTVEAIRRKLEAVNNQLATHLAQEADAIENLWTRAIWLEKKSTFNLWKSAVQKYAADTKLPTWDHRTTHLSTSGFSIREDHADQKYNIRLSLINVDKHRETIKVLSPSSGHTRAADGTISYYNYYFVNVDENVHFVISDASRGFKKRINHHYRTAKSNMKHSSTSVCIISPADKTRAMDVQGFMNEIHNPPQDVIFKIADLLELPRSSATIGRNVSILKLKERGTGRYDDEMVWRAAGKGSDFDENQTYYYVPLNGYKMISEYGYTDVKHLYECVNRCKIGSFNGDLYGIRKADMEWVQEQDNWINLEEYIKENIQKYIQDNKRSIIRSSLSGIAFTGIDKGLMNHISSNGLFYKTYTMLSKVKDYKGDIHKLTALARAFSQEGEVKKVFDMIAKYQALINKVHARYQLLGDISRYTSIEKIAHYINLVDKMEGSK
jgi:hypothetical protein